jgi:hypothetical protein
MAAHVDMEMMKKLLALDLPHVQIASALGCTDSYISQCLENAEFKAAVSTLRITRLTAASARDDKIDRLEDKVLDNLEKTIPYIMRPKDALDAFKILNAAKRTSQQGVNSQNGGAGTGQLVTILLPVGISSQFVRNANNEIIEAGGRSLAALPSKVLQQMAANQLAIPKGNSNERTPEALEGIEVARNDAAATR